MTTILSVIGTRPEAIKMAPVVLEATRRAAACGLRLVTCVTSQHRDMLDQVLETFAVTPDHDLDVMEVGQSPSRVAELVFGRLTPLIDAERPDWVLVQGDTTTAMAAAFVAFHARCRVGHVEAGLRTHDRRHPFPEEVNRRTISQLADRHFAPTSEAAANLRREGVPESAILVTGNPVIDALQQTIARADALAMAHSTELAGVPIDDPSRPVLLVTSHRRENQGDGIRRVCDAIRVLSQRYGGRLVFVCPVHPSASVREPVHELLRHVPGVYLLAPLSYPALVRVLSSCRLVLTDSGGLQEEAPSLGKPVLVMRDQTERPEAVAAGTARVVGTDASRIVSAVTELIESPSAYARMACAMNPYGDGAASARIVASLVGEDVQPFRPAVASGPPTVTPP